MYRLARELGLAGFVRNDREGVWLEVEGMADAVDCFVGRIATAVPPAARIDRVEIAALRPCQDDEFRIADSETAVAGPRVTAIPADLAPCADCLRELADPEDRRYRYPFINCTACGPRFTIVREVPYDRPNTTMAPFVMCRACRSEYEAPADRRFHAEPIACPACGPIARFDSLEGDAAVRAAAAAIVDRAIVAVKGAGGFVLAVDATSETAVARLRDRKQRPHKPFAVMVRSLDIAERIAVLDERARQALASPQRPIVLAPTRGCLPRNIAPGLSDIGVFLPPTPLQHLLLADGPALQVMTSGNVSDEPIARTNAEARERLAGIADVFLTHDREIHARADDSVVRPSRDRTIPMRRARGFVPETIAVPKANKVVLAVGGHERSTVCLAHAGTALLSPHIGDLDHPDADAFFRESIAHLETLLGVPAEVVVHDLHPDYRSTRWALASGLPALAVQHHHAHVAACLAEHGRTDRVVGIAFDGTGLGEDGALWGGEILIADLAASRRVGRLRPIALAGGEAAIREPWRVALAALVDAGESPELLDIGASERRRVAALLASGLPSQASGAGRWFDAVAVLLGAAPSVSYDGQAAAQLEAFAGSADGSAFELAFTETVPFEVDLRPAIRELVHELQRGVSRQVLAARFHSTFAYVIRESARRLMARTVVLTGGCFQNRRLLDHASALLALDGVEVLSHRRVPPNDGGLALGQAAIAAFRLSGGR
jgi:hydrogenase maturation protein HypF